MGTRPTQLVGGGAESAETTVLRVTGRAAVRAERIISYCRLAFCAALLVRFPLLGGEMPAAAYVLNVLALAAGIVFSLWMLSIRYDRAIALALPLATVVDAVVCFCSLLQTALWGVADNGYRGLLTVPDMCIVPILVFSSAFRLSQRLAALAGVLHTASLVALFRIDSARLGDVLGYGYAQVSMFGFVFVVSCAGAVMLARQARGLAESAALDSLRVESARREMIELLRTQHDTRSLLAAASLHAELVCSALSTAGRAADAMPHRWAESLRTDLAEVNDWIRSLGERAFAGLSSIGEAERVETERVLPLALSMLASRFQGVKLEAHFEALPAVQLAGGAASLQRILFNMVANAVEGDGTRGGSKVRICTSVRDSHLLLSVEDDGPGFPLESLGASACLTTKANGTGFGLYAVTRMLEASGGFLNRANAAGSGAIVTAGLPIQMG